MMWINPGRQPSTTTATRSPLHPPLLPPARVGWGERKGRVKAAELVGRDENSVKSEKVQEERKKTSEAKAVAYHVP